MKRSPAIIAIAALGIGIAAGFALWPRERPALPAESAVARSDWSEMPWPFPLDQWGRGKAYECSAAHCGTSVRLYVRAKIGFCNCQTGVADDEELERISDFILVGEQVAALGDGRPITIGWMKGRSRGYRLTAATRPGPAALTIGFNDKCDAIVATVVVPHERPREVETQALTFLNSPGILRWAEVTLGL